MRQIITLHIGQAGIQIGQSFWQLLCIQHGININSSSIINQTIRNNNNNLPSHNQSTNNQSIYIQTTNNQSINNQQNQSLLQQERGDPSVVFDQTRKGKYISRSYWMDSDPMTIDTIKNKSNHLYHIHHPDRFLTQKQGSCAFFTNATYSFNNNREQIQNHIRKLIQACHNIHVQAIIITSSINGGTGSGYTSSLLSMLNTLYPKIILITFLIYPSQHYSNLIVQPYNAVYAHNQIVNQSDINIIFTNQKLYSVSQKFIMIEKPNFSNINQLISHAISSITAGQRFQKYGGTNLQHLLTNLIPYPKLNSLVPSYSPMIPESQTYKQNLSIDQITKNCFNQSHNLTTFQLSNSTRQDLCCSILYRGQITQMETTRVIQQIKSEKQLLNLVQWSPTGLHVSHLTNLPKFFPNESMGRFRKQCCILANSSVIKPYLQQIMNKYDKMYETRCFLHWYGGYCSSSSLSQPRQNFQRMLRDYDQIC